MINNQEILNDWTFCKGFNKDWTKTEIPGQMVHLPHQVVEIPLNSFDEEIYQGVFTYQKKITLPECEEEVFFTLRFEGVMLTAEIFMNGTFLGSHRGGYTPFEREIPQELYKEESLLLTVKVDSRETPGIAPFGNVVDYLAYGGIYREVSLRTYAINCIKNCKIEYSLTELDNQKTGLLNSLDAILNLENRLLTEKTVSICVELTKDNNTVFSYEKNTELASGKSDLVINMEPILPIELWNIDSPNLYSLRIVVKSGSTEDIYEIKLGFRTIVFNSEGFFLNNRRLQLTGLNRHQSFPYVGYAMPKRAQKKDADILKHDLGLNCVRSSHYPPSIHFLERCDEIGLLVFEELPGWQYIGDSQWKELACSMLEDMIKRDWNHPSVISWGVRINESPDDREFYTRTNNLSRTMDPTRPTSGIRYLEGSEFLEDIYTFNDFSHKGGENVLLESNRATGLEKDIPYLVTEYNGHMYPTKSFDQEERLVEHALRHTRVQNQAGKDKKISGAIGWCAFDYNTHYQFGSGDRICYHGVMDMFRFPKTAASVYSSQVSPEKKIVLDPGTRWARGERNIGMIPPYVIYTNCDEAEIFYGENSLGRFSPDKEGFPGLEHPPIVIKEPLFGLWGADWRDVRFIGIIKGKKVCSVFYPKNPVPQTLILELDSSELESKAWDCTRASFTVRDQAGHPVSFIDAVLELEILGPGEIIGDSILPLISGRRGVWIKTLPGEPGTIRLSGKCRNMKSNIGEIEVIDG